MAFIKGQAVTQFPFKLVGIADLLPITSGTVTGYVTKSGVQSALTGTATHIGNGRWSWSEIAAAAMDDDEIGLDFIHDDGYASFTIKTVSGAQAAAAADEGNTLDQALGELQIEVAYFLGFTRDSDNWSQAKTNLIDAIVQSGLRRFYWPPPLPGQAIAHEWSFLKPTTTLDLNAPYSTGTIAIASGVVTLTGGTFPTWAASGVLRVNSLTYSVDSRDSGTQLTLDDTSLTVSSGASYELSQEDYDLPSDFGHLEGAFTFPPNLRWPPVQIVGEGVLRQMRQAGDGSTGTPRYAAVCPKVVPASTTTGQRFAVKFKPGPDAAHVLSYRYAVLPDKLTTANAMPYGGIAMAETLLEACLSVAEERRDDARGAHYQAFMERLAAAIAFDSRNRPDTLGYAYDRSDDMYSPRYPVSQHVVTYNGNQY